MPEFDTPGHANCWGNGYPNLFPNCPGKAPVFDPIQNYTYDFMSNFLSEMMQLFADDFVHLGGDEVTFDCWKADSSITTFMQQNHISSYPALQGLYEQKVSNMVLGGGKYPVFWDEVFGQTQFPINKQSIIEVWDALLPEMVKVVQAGYRAIYSTPWYLDREDPDSQTWYLWQDTWKSFYEADPIGNSSLTPSEMALVLGGEACMWGEQVDFTDFEVRVWPRAGAIAERLWSPVTVVNINAAEPRLGHQRCRMVRRGISAGPIYPDYCELGPDNHFH